MPEGVTGVLSPDVTHTAHTVLHPLDLPHAPNGLSMHHGPCPVCGSHPSFSFSQKAADCKRCHGSIGEDGPELGLEPDQHVASRYLPGQTVHLLPDHAASLLAAGLVAPAGAENVEELLVRAAAQRLGLSIAE